MAGRGIAIAVTDPQTEQPVLMADEHSAVATAIPSRQREFAAGRAAARRAMLALGGVALPIPAAPDRAPLWPDGWQGSISHTRTLCVAAVTQMPVTLGLDVEGAEPLNETLISRIASDRELSGLTAPDRAKRAKAIFSAKEAAYKAQYPITKALFGFDHLEIAFDGDSDGFTATYLAPSPPFATGDILQGRQITVADHLVSLVTIGQFAPKGA